MTGELPGDLPAREKLERMIRVDHAGEYGATRIYAGQLAVLGRGGKGEVLRRMEAKGEIRGGRFVSGFTGEQFARPEALDLLRAVRKGEREISITVSNADPLNLSGIIMPGPRISRLAALGLIPQSA